MAEIREFSHLAFRIVRLVTISLPEEGFPKSEEELTPSTQWIHTVSPRVPVCPRQGHLVL